MRRKRERRQEKERGEKENDEEGGGRKRESEKTTISLHLEPEVKYILSSTVCETSSHNIGHELGLILKQETTRDQGLGTSQVEAQYRNSCTK